LSAGRPCEGRMRVTGMPGAACGRPLSAGSVAGWVGVVVTDMG
jgi:hypothetical protein